MSQKNGLSMVLEQSAEDRLQTNKQNYKNRKRRTFRHGINTIDGHTSSTKLATNATYTSTELCTAACSRAARCGRLGAGPGRSTTTTTSGLDAFLLRGALDSKNIAHNSIHVLRFIQVDRHKQIMGRQIQATAGLQVRIDVFLRQVDNRSHHQYGAEKQKNTRTRYRVSKATQARSNKHSGEIMHPLKVALHQTDQKKISFYTDSIGTTMLNGRVHTRNTYHHHKRRLGLARLRCSRKDLVDHSKSDGKKTSAS